jgi:DNA-directed RNA polymerase subunit RPC12/RpoP
MRFIATFFDRFVPAGVRVQKSAFRRHLGLLLPVRCPYCRMYTKQRPAETKEFRVCLSCGREFSKYSVRRQNRIDGVRGLAAPFGFWR